VALRHDLVEVRDVRASTHQAFSSITCAGRQTLCNVEFLRPSD
jgi:hypothetical protein